MSTLNVNLPEPLLTRIANLAAHEGVSPSQFVVETMTEKIENLEIASFAQGERIDSGMHIDSLQPLTIIHVPELGASPHDHLAPYNEG